jgi:hypothetical protein
MIVIEGRRPRPDPRSEGYSVQRYLALPDTRAPEVLLPIDQRLPAVYAIENWTVPTKRWKAVRNRLLIALASRGAFPTSRNTVHVAIREGFSPFIVAAARSELGLPPVAGWFLTLGEGDALTRGVFHVFRLEERSPGWVVKFARVPGNVTPFEGDQRGLELVARAGGEVATHAPRLLGRFDVNGLPALAETAAPGRRLAGVLQLPGRRSAKLRHIESVAEWLVEMAKTTAAPHDLLAPEIRRLSEQVLPHWRQNGATANLVEGLAGVPAVLEHRDLGSWNVIANFDGFTAVDWESARAHGFPLWDLLYFLTDGLAHFDGSSPMSQRPQHMRRLFRGELASSAMLFEWIRRMVAALELAPAAVGCLATASWLHHGRLRYGREADVAALAPDTAPLETHFESLARSWLSDPALGVGWNGWRRS